MKNFLKPTRVTWMTFAALFLFSSGSILAVIYFGGAPVPFLGEQSSLPIFVHIWVWINIVINVPTGLLIKPTYELFRIVGAPEIYFGLVAFLFDFMYWYVLGSIVSYFWYKLKSKSKPTNLQPNT